VKTTPLHSFHLRHNARMTEFAGWQLPLLYTGIAEEHRRTREGAGLFDISHMGRIELRGDDAGPLLQRVCTRRIDDQQVGQSRYSHVCNEQGGILDDVIVSRYADRWLMVCNAANRLRILAWLEEHAAGRRVTIQDRTESTMMVALQGPQALAVAERRLPMPVRDIGRYRFVTGEYLFFSYTVFRSGYTGEDGLEIILPASLGAMAAGFLGELLEAGVTPAGLGARDTLRLEAGMPLYGHELTEAVDPISAGQGWCVDLTRDFIGVQALRRVADQGPARRLVGLELEGRRIARQGAVVRLGERPVGQVTSGTLSPTLDRSIAMAYVDAALAVEETALCVDLGGRPTPAKVVRLPFYRRK